MAIPAIRVVKDVVELESIFPVNVGDVVVVSKAGIKQTYILTGNDPRAVGAWKIVADYIGDSIMTPTMLADTTSNVIEIHHGHDRKYEVYYVGKNGKKIKIFDAEIEARIEQGQAVVIKAENYEDDGDII